jgi:hypothetical protein
MLIATFAPTTAWAGRKITHEGEAFLLEGHGALSAADIMEYDRQGHLLWVDAGTRAWVGSRAQASGTSRPATAVRRTSTARDATEDPRPQPATRRRSRLKRALLIAIGALVITNTVLLLNLLGVFRGP